MSEPWGDVDLILVHGEWYENRWNDETVDRYVRMCNDSGTRFDPDMCDEVGELIREIRAECK